MILRTDRAGVAPVYDSVGAVVLNMDRADVDTVLVGGRVVKRAGHLLWGDITSPLHEVQKLHDRLSQLGVLERSGNPTQL